MPRKGEKPTEAQLAALRAGQERKRAKQAAAKAAKASQSAASKGVAIDTDAPPIDDGRLGPTRKVTGHAPTPPPIETPKPTPAAPLAPPPAPPAPPAPPSAPEPAPVPQDAPPAKPKPPSEKSPDVPDNTGRSPEKSSGKPGGLRRALGAVHRGLGG